MKSLICLRLSLKNIFNNKTRFFLAIIIITVVSFCMFILMNLSLNFLDFTDKLLDAQYKADGDYLQVYKSDDDYPRSLYFTNEEKDFIFDKLIENRENIDSVSLEAEGRISDVNSAYFRLKLFHEQFRVDYHDTLVAGEWWSPDDDFTENGIWLSESFIQRYPIGGYLFFEIYGQGNIKRRAESYVVKGFIKSQNSYYSNGDFAYIHHTKSLAHSLSAEKQPVPNGKYWNDIITFKNIQNSILKEFPKANEVFASNYTILKNLLLTYGLILVGFLILSFVLFGTSLNTVVNTLKMSIEEDMRSMGMLLALGMKVKSVKNVIKIQGFLICFISVLISSIVMIFLTKPVRVLFDEIFVSNMFLEVEWQYHYIIAVPILVCLFLYSMILLFIRKKLKTFNKIDVISVINEVA